MKITENVLGVVVCHQTLHHKKVKYRYLIWKGEMVDDPTPQDVARWVAFFEQKKLPYRFISAPCKGCRSII